MQVKEGAPAGKKYLFMGTAHYHRAVLMENSYEIDLQQSREYIKFVCNVRQLYCYVLCKWSSL